MTAKSRKLAQGLLHQWGFLFTYTAIRGLDSSKLPPISQDLALALKLFKSSTALAKPEDHPAIADHYYQALLLSRNLVLYQFLESLPRDLSADQARKEWLFFQLRPPHTPDNDLFVSVFRAVVSGSRENLRSRAKSWMSTTAWRHFRWFQKSFLVYDCAGTPIPCVNPDAEQPSFHVVIDEVISPAIDGARLHSRRANKRRQAVRELFWPESSS